MAGGNDLEEQIRRLAQETGDPEMRAWLLKPMTAPALREDAHGAILRATTPLTEEFRRGLRNQWNGDVERPQWKALSPEEVRSGKQVHCSADPPTADHSTPATSDTQANTHYNRRTKGP